MPNNRQSLFNEEGIRGREKADSVAPSVSRKTIVRWTHGIATTIAVVVLVTQRVFVAGPAPSALTMVGWGLLAAWPYGFSYLVASTVNTRSFVSTLVQTILMYLVTSLVCSAYLGQLFDATLHTWEVAVVTVVHAFFLLAACGAGESAARQMESNELPALPARRWVAWAHVILALIAAGSWLSRSTVWQLEYLRDNGFNLVSYMLLAVLPYLLSGLLSRQLVTASRWKPWALVGILTLGTAFAVVNYSGIWQMERGLLGVWLVVIVQFIAFIFVAEWALDDTEW